MDFQFFYCCDLENLPLKVTKIYQFFVMSQLSIHENLFENPATGSQIIVQTRECQESVTQTPTPTKSALKSKVPLPVGFGT